MMTLFLASIAERAHFLGICNLTRKGAVIQSHIAMQFIVTYFRQVAFNICGPKYHETFEYYCAMPFWQSCSIRAGGSERWFESGVLLL